MNPLAKRKLVRKWFLIWYLGFLLFHILELYTCFNLYAFFRRFKCWTKVLFIVKIVLIRCFDFAKFQLLYLWMSYWNLSSIKTLALCKYCLLCIYWYVFSVSAFASVCVCVCVCVCAHVYWVCIFMYTRTHIFRSITRILSSFVLFFPSFYL